MKVRSLIDSKKRAEVKKALAEGRLDKLLEKKKAEAAPEKLSQKTEDTALKEGLDRELLEAVDSGNLNRVLAALDKGADPNVRNKDGETALMVASRENLGEIVGFLIDKGADIEARDAHGLTALMHSCRCETAGSMYLLIGYGADLNARDKESKTPIMHAFERFGHGRGQANDFKGTCIDGVSLLIREGASVDTKDMNGKTVLMYAIDGIDGDMKALECVLALGPKNKNEKNRYGATARGMVDRWEQGDELTEAVKELLRKYGVTRE